MADINQTPPVGGGPRAENRRPHSAPGSDRPAPDDLMDVVELLFFAYRDFIQEPDAILAEFGFGRAHHRVLHFVTRHPGLKVAELLDILRITKQSLSRVLKQLVDQGHVAQVTGATDRRQRLLFPTARGRELAQRLAAPQLERMSWAMRAAGNKPDDAVRLFLFNMVADADRERVSRLIAAGKLNQSPRRESI